MASFFIREYDSAYRAVVKYRDADGVWRQKTRVFAKQGDARSWALEETTKSEAVVLTHNASPTLAEHLDQCEPSIARHHRGYANSERFRLSTLRNSWLGKSTSTKLALISCVATAISEPRKSATIPCFAS